MLPFRNILFPVDYSEPCKAVVPYVKEMTRQFSANLTLVHAYGAEALALSDLAITDARLPDDAQLLQQQRLRCFAKDMFPGQHVESLVHVGEPGGIIDQVIQRQGADLVMLATHGRGPIRRLLLGSVAAKVLHDVSTAVWTGVGSVFTGHTPRLPYKSIVCALDASEESEAVLRAAAALAHIYQAQLSLVHVIEAPRDHLEIDFGPYKKELIDAADFRLRELKGNAGIDAPHTVVDAIVADGVRQEAIRKNADLVISGRGQAQNTFSRVFSQLYSIVRESPCPVLSI